MMKINSEALMKKYEKLLPRSKPPTKGKRKEGKRSKKSRGKEPRPGEREPQVGTQKKKINRTTSDSNQPVKRSRRGYPRWQCKEKGKQGNNRPVEK